VDAPTFTGRRSPNVTAPGPGFVKPGFNAGRSRCCALVEEHDSRPKNGTEDRADCGEGHEVNLCANWWRTACKSGCWLGLAGRGALPAAPARRPLVYWHVLLGACLLLPFCGVKAESGTRAGSTPCGVVPVQSAPRRACHRPARSPCCCWRQGALARLLAGGGIWKKSLRQYRRHSLPLETGVFLEVEPTADFRRSGQPGDIRRAKTVVLLPAGFRSSTRILRKPLCHEILHVGAADWLFQVWRSWCARVFWFHPAIWWLLGEIAWRASRRWTYRWSEVTKSREHTWMRLLAIAGARPRLTGPGAAVPAQAAT